MLAILTVKTFCKPCLTKWRTLSAGIALGYLFQIQSEFGQKLAGLRAKVCEPKSFSCSDWKIVQGELRARSVFVG